MNAPTPHLTAETQLGYCPACAKPITGTSHVAVDLKSVEVENANSTIANATVEVAPKIVGFETHHACGEALKPAVR